MVSVAGVDGCAGGWLVSSGLVQGDHIDHINIALLGSFEEVLSNCSVCEWVVVDMPIGLTDDRKPGGRECDRMARKMLKPPRASSVFSPASRDQLHVEDWETARKCGFSKQSLAILPKIREVDALMTPEVQKRIVESHPELAFMSLAGHPATHPKKKIEGREERLSLLSNHGGGAFREIETAFRESKKRLKASLVASDDILDACSLAWLGLRIHLGCAATLPPQPPLDARGLRMEMWHGLKNRGE